MRTPLLKATLAALVLASVPARGEMTADDIQKCVEKNLAEKTSIQTVTMRSTDRVGVETHFEAKIFWRRFDDGLSRVLVRIYSPESRRGSALLLVEGKNRADIFMYMPELRKVKRVSKTAVQGSVFGTDFSYEDFERLQRVAEDSEGKRLPDEEVNGRKTYVVEFRPARGDESEYKRVVAYVDQEWCVPLRVDHFEAGERLRKVLSVPAEKVGEFEGKHIPQLLSVKDLVDETHTDMIIDELELNVEIPEEDFSSGNLEF